MTIWMFLLITCVLVYCIGFLNTCLLVWSAFCLLMMYEHPAWEFAFFVLGLGAIWFRHRLSHMFDGWMEYHDQYN